MDDELEGLNHSQDHEQKAFQQRVKDDRCNKVALHAVHNSLSRLHKNICCSLVRHLLLDCISQRSIVDVEVD